MRVVFVYPAFDRHADSHPELHQAVPCDEYLGPPSLGIASLAANTPPGHEIRYVDDRVTPFDPDMDGDLFALSFFTPAATRGLAIGDALLARGKTVVMGGIFPTQMPAVAAAHCTSVVVGEGEEVWPRILSDAVGGSLRPRYDAPPIEDLGSLPPPRLDLYLDAETSAHRPDDYPLQLTRGCPLRCDACVLPSVMGRALRFQSEENLRSAMTQLAAAGKRISFTEDTSVMAMQGARRRFRAFLDLCVELQREGLELAFSYLGISMPMILHLDAALLSQLRATGIDRFYLVGGFDRTTRDAFGKGDSQALRAGYEAIQRCHDFGIDPYVSFLVGNPDDDERVFDRMLEFANKARIGLAEFCISTPYPGTPIWHTYCREGRIFDTTWKRYNDANCVFTPHRMTPDALTEGYLYLWREFYRGRRAEIVERDDRLRRTIQF